MNDVKGYNVETNKLNRTRFMLTITGQQYRFCDGLSRRGFLTVGGLAMGGLTLPQLLRAEAQQGTGRSHKAIINILSFTRIAERVGGSASGSHTISCCEGAFNLKKR